MEWNARSGMEWNGMRNAEAEAEAEWNARSGMEWNGMREAEAK
jgi:hypothetical protein